MRVAELMTKNPVTVTPKTSLADLAGLMNAHHFNGLPVTDSAGRLVGMITQADLLRRPELGTDRRRTGWLSAFLLRSRVEDDYVHTHGRYVDEVMTADPLCVPPDAELAQAAGLMTEKHLKSLPVTRDSVLVGILSRSDIIRALASRLIHPAAASDDAIGNAILAELARQHWAPKAGIRINVAAGVVDLEGVIFSDSERRAVMVIAENAAGVTHVNDHLVYIDAGSGMAFPALM